MKKYRFLSVIIACLLIIICHSASFSQNQPVLKQRITLHENNISLRDFLQKLNTQFDINFSYVPSQLPVDSLVSVEATDKQLKKVLREILHPLHIQYLVVEKQIILKPEKKSRNEGKSKKTKMYTMSGIITDKSTREVLIGANIAIKNTGTGTISNSYGFYSMTLDEGEYEILFSFVGYKAIQTRINLDSDKKLNIGLETKESVLNEVRVNEQDGASNSTQMSGVRLNQKSLSQIPAMFGETDLIKSLNTIPGIKSHGDGSTSFFVRGGNRDQNLILLDEAPIYNPAHLFGFFSIFVSDAIKNVKIYKGDFPAKYGGRLSSLIDVKMKDGDMNNYHVNGSLGLISAKLSVEGPLVKEKSSFFASVRRSHLSKLLRSDEFDMNFNDINIKLNYIANSKNRFFLSGYFGNDIFYSGIDINRSGIGWGNAAGTLRWNHLFNDRIFSNTTFYMSRYDYFLVFSEADNIYWNSFIGNIALKTDFTAFLNLNNTLRFGYNINWHFFNPGNIEQKTDTTSIQFPFVPESRSREMTVYLTHDTKLSDKLSLKYGLRIPLWQNIGKSDIIKYDKYFNPLDTISFTGDDAYNSYLRAEPRLSLEYKLSPSSNLKASLCRTFQFIQLLSNSISPFTSLEVWIPSSPNVKPQRADQFAAGFDKQFVKNHLYLSLEAFYKKMTNQIDYKDHARMLLNPLLESELRFGDAWSYGLEFLLRKTRGRMTGWISYTLSKTRRIIKGLNLDRIYPAAYDRPHDFNIYCNYRFSDRWDISATWKYTTGAAITQPTGFYYYQNYSVPVYTEKNNARLPDYHRLDVSVGFDINPGTESRFRHDLTLSVFNLYGRKNPMTYNFNKIITENGIFVIPSDYSTYTERESSKYYLIGFIPSVTYNFRF